MHLVKEKDNKGKLTYQARVGDFFGPVRHSPQEATKGLDAELDSYHPLNHDYLMFNSGMFHIFQVPSHGWVARIVPNTGYTGHGLPAKTRAEAHIKSQEWAERHGWVSIK